MKEDAIKEFIAGFAQTAWRRWTVNQIKDLKAAQLPRMSGKRRMKYLLAVAEMVQMVAHGAARGKKVELHPEN